VEIAARRGTAVGVTTVRALLGDTAPEVVGAVLREIPCEAVTKADRWGGVFEIADTDRGSLRYPAVRLLARCRPSGVCSGLVGILSAVGESEGDQPGAWIVVEALEDCCGTASVTAIESFVETHRSPEQMGVVTTSNVRKSLELATEALGRVGGRSSLQALRLRLSDPYYRVRLAALRAAEGLGLACELYPALVELSFHDERPAVRKEAIRVLSNAKCR
jgi:hypothetical protein